MSAWLSSLLQKRSHIMKLSIWRYLRTKRHSWEEYDTDTDYMGILRYFHCHICRELDHIGRENPKTALQWCYDIEKSDVIYMRKRKLNMAPLMIDMALAFLSIHPSSDSCERRFGVAGHNERIGDKSYTVVCQKRCWWYVVFRWPSKRTQLLFLGKKAQGVTDLAVMICR